MEQRRLGRTGLKVSRLCLGMMSYGDPSWRSWVLPGDQAKAFVQQAADVGITFFDTADMYSKGVSEEVTGAALRSVFPRREDYVLATKVFYPMGDGPNDAGLSRGHILDAVDASLRRLGTDHIDLYQIHRWDPDTPVEETMEALHDCVRAGKVRYLGMSEAAPVIALQRYSRARFLFTSQYERTAGSVGKALDGVEIGLLADDGTPIVPPQPGSFSLDWAPAEIGCLLARLDPCSRSVAAPPRGWNRSF